LGVGTRDEGYLGSVFLWLGVCRVGYNEEYTIDTRRGVEALDELTGLPGRRHFLYLAQSKLEANKSLLLPVRYSFIYFNISNFKFININLGIAEGDLVLKRFADTLRKVFSECLISRFSDDHFVVLTTENDVIERIRKTSEVFHQTELGKGINIKAGIYHLFESGVTLAVAADLAKYACDYIKNDEYFYMVYHAGLERKGELAKYLTHNLDRAIEQGAIKVYYQPVIRTLTGDLCGKEALSRWIDPVRGFLSPADFIPVLEKEKMIHKLDIFIVHQVCRDLKNQLERGEDPVPVSINFSRLDFQLCDPFEEVENAARQYGIPHALLNVEITESCLMNDPDNIKHTIDRFHKEGYQVWMDDFGSGFSSLNVLKDFDFDEIKIDMIFLSSFTERSKRIIRHIIMMAKELGLETLAEGVETEEQYQFLRENGCQKVQGYYFGKPAVQAAFLDSLKEKKIHSESMEEREYATKIGQVNVITYHPLALLEDDGENFRYCFINEAYIEQLHSLGTQSVEQATFNLNNRSSTMHLAYRKYAEQAETKDEKVVITYTDRGQTMRLEAKRVASMGKRHMLVMSLENLQIQDKSERQHAIDMYAKSLYYLYDSAYVLHLDENYTEELMQYGSFTNFGTNAGAIEEILAMYVDKSIYVDDRERYLKYADPKTILERLKASPKGILREEFRTLNNKTGMYEWKTHIAIIPPNTDKNIIVEFIRDTSRDLVTGIRDPKTIDRDSLFGAMIQNTEVPYVWKDAERRIAGVNEAFIRFTGIRAFSDIAGKTDEDAGWYVDIEEDHNASEMRCLLNGEVILNKKAQWIIGGVPRNIIFSQYPVYKDGRIVGIMETIQEQAEHVGARRTVSDATMRDPITGALNNYAARSLGERLDDRKRIQGYKYVLSLVRIENADYLFRSHGDKFGNDLLRKAAYVINKHKYGTSILARVGYSDFMLIDSSSDKAKIERYIEEIQEELEKIDEVNSVSCELIVKTASAISDEAVDHETLRWQLDQMIRTEGINMPDIQISEQLKGVLDLYEDVPVPFAVFRAVLSKDGNSVIDTEYVYVNQKYCDLSDTKKEDLIGKSYLTVMKNAASFWFKYCYDAVVLRKEGHTRVYSPEVESWMQVAIKPSVISGCCTFTFQIIDEEVKERDELESQYMTDDAVIRITQLLNSKEEYEVQIRNLLQEISYAIHPERLLLVEVGDSKNASYYDWAAEGVGLSASELDIFKTKERINLAWYRTLNEDTSYELQNRESVKEINPQLYEILVKMDVHKLLAVPMYYDGRMVGYLCASDFEADTKVNAKRFLEKIASYVAAKIANHRAMQDLEYLSNYDSLTGIRNRHAALMKEEQLEQIRTSAGLIYADLNDLKLTNDVKGHEEGDKLLIAAAKMLSELFGTKAVYRMGGDEFLVVLEGVDESAFETAKSRIIKRLEEEKTINFSIGYVWCKDTREIRAAIAEADKRMYENKEIYHTTHPRIR